MFHSFRYPRKICLEAFPPGSSVRLERLTHVVRSLATGLSKAWGLNASWNTRIIAPGIVHSTFEDSGTGQATRGMLMIRLGQERLLRHGFNESI